MTKITIVTRDGTAHPVSADGARGFSLMEVIRNNGFDELEAMCGGCCSCATCHVLIDEAWMSALPPISAEESDLLDGAAERQDGSRLSCQIRVSPGLDGLRVTIAPD